MTRLPKTLAALGVVALASACGGGGGGGHEPGPVSAAVSTVGSSPASVVADGAAASTVTVTLLDASGVPIPGKAVTLTSSRGMTDTISAASGPSSASGVVTFTVTSLAAGAPSFTAVDSTDGVTLARAAQVAFVSGPASGTVSTVASSPPSVVADGSATSTVTVTLLDANGNPVSGEAVTLSSSRGATDSISAASGASNTSGVVTFAIRSTTAGSSTCTAAVGLTTLAQTAQVRFAAGGVSAIASTVSSSPASVVADGTTATITVTVLDAHANPVAGKAVTLSSSRGATDLVSAASGASDASGVVTFTVGSTVAGTSTYSAEVELLPIAQTAQVGFVAGPVSATLSTVGSSPSTVVADGSTTSTVFRERNVSVRPSRSFTTAEASRSMPV